MELTSKLLAQIVIQTKPKTEEHMLLVMDKSIHEGHLFQPLQTNNKQFKIAITFSTGYSGISNVIGKKNKFCFAKSLTDDDSTVITIPQGACERESLINEIERISREEDYFTETNSAFKISPIFSALGSIVEILEHGQLISHMTDDKIYDKF